VGERLGDTLREGVAPPAEVEDVGEGVLEGESRFYSL
jgi:hypothetical protein